MGVTNEFYVARGKTITCRGQKFQEGRRFPAADLGMDQRGFDSLLKDKVLVTGKERNLFVHPAAVPPHQNVKVTRPPVVTTSDDFDRMSKDDLLDMAADLGVTAAPRWTKAEIIAAIKEKRT